MCRGDRILWISRKLTVNTHLHICGSEVLCTPQWSFLPIWNPRCANSRAWGGFGQFFSYTVQFGVVRLYSSSSSAGLDIDQRISHMETVPPNVDVDSEGGIYAQECWWRKESQSTLAVFDMRLSASSRSFSSVYQTFSLKSGRVCGYHVDDHRSSHPPRVTFLPKNPPGWLLLQPALSPMSI